MPFCFTREKITALWLRRSNKELLALTHARLQTPPQFFAFLLVLYGLVMEFISLGCASGGGQARWELKGGIFRAQNSAFISENCTVLCDRAKKMSCPTRQHLKKHQHHDGGKKRFRCYTRSFRTRISFYTLATWNMRLTTTSGSFCHK